MQFTFLFLTKNCLYNFSKSNQQLQLTFLPEQVHYQEIIDNKSFDALLTDYFSKYPKCEAILLLSDDIVFQKRIAITSETVIDEEIKKFIDIIPYTTSNIENKVIRTKDALSMYAVNCEIYKTITKIAQQNTWKISHVVPLAPFSDILQNQPISYSALAPIVKEKQLLKTLDFMKQDEIKAKKKFHPNYSFCFF